MRKLTRPLGDLVPDITEVDLATCFASCGPIHSIKVIRNTSGQCKGAFATRMDNLQGSLSSTFYQLPLRKQR